MLLVAYGQRMDGVVAYGLLQYVIDTEQTLSAFWLILLAGSIILQSAGVTPSLNSVLSGVMTTCSALGCVRLYFTIERVGRRAVLLYGAIALSILMFIFTVL
jgi:hypothetical protein